MKMTPKNVLSVVVFFIPIGRTGLTIKTIHCTSTSKLLYLVVGYSGDIVTRLSKLTI